MPKRLLVQILLEGLPLYRSLFLKRLKASDKFDFKVYPAHQSDPGLFNTGDAVASFASQIVRPEEPAKALLGGRFSWHDHFKLDPDLAPGDVVVCAGNPRFLNIYPLTIAARRRRLSTLWWCQGWSIGSPPIATKIRHWLCRHFPNGLMLYTEKEADAFVANGFPRDRTFFLNNTIDQSLAQAEIDRLDEAALTAFRDAEDITDRQVLLFCSRLTEKTRLSEAIDAVDRLRAAHPGILLAVIGDGALRDALESLVRERGLTAHVRFLGAMFEEAKLAPWFLSAVCMVYPGAIGLSLLHAFSYGTTVVTHDNLHNQNPEIAALEHEQNGFMFRENDVADLAHHLDRLLKDPAMRSRMSQAAYNTAHQDFTIEAMVSNFEQAVLSIKQHAH